MAELETLFARYARSGDPRDLAEVFDRAAPELLRLALHLVRREDDAEDLLQATFLTAIQKARRFDPRRPLLPWLCGVLANHARRQAKSAARRRLSLRKEREPDPLERAAAAELHSALHASLERLEEGYRTPLRLRLIDGLSTVEIAWRLRRSPGAVRVAIHRGLDKLRRLLPPGLALSAGVSLPSGRGLTAVRGRILSRATVSTGPHFATLGSMVLMKKLLVTCVLALTLLIVWWTLPGAPDGPALTPPAPGPAAPRLASATEALPVGPDTATAERETLSQDPPGLAALTLRVRWERDGLPAAGVMVRVDPQDGVDPRFHDLEGRTGPDGRLRFDAIPPGLAQVSLDRHVDLERELPPDQETVVDIVVPSGLELHGRVVDTAGLSVPGAEVFVDPARVLDEVPEIVTPAAVTDGDGGFYLSSVGQHTSIGARAASGYSRILTASPAEEPGEARPMTLILEGPGLDVHGRVVDRDGNGVPGALVAIGDPGRSNPAQLPDGTMADFWHAYHLRADEEGRFLAEGLRPGASQVRVTSPDHAPYLDELKLPPPGNELIITLDAGSSVQGIVADADGDPIPGAVVLPRGRRIDLLRTARLMRTDPLGRFTLGGLAPGPAVLLAHAEGYETAEAELLLNANEASSWYPRLSPLPRIRGSVVDGGGLPLGDVRVLARPAVPAPTGVVTGPADLPVLDTTDGSGHFDIPVPPGLEYSLSLTEKVAHFEIPCDLPPLSGGGEELRLILPDARRATARIAGILVDDDGNPIGDSWLQLTYDGNQRAVGDTDVRSGAFSIGLLSPGRYWLRASPRDPQLPPWTLGPLDLYPHQILDLGRVEPPATGELTFRYTGPDGKRIEQISAFLDDAHGDTIVLSAVPDAETRHRLPVGDYTLDVFGTGFVTISAHPVRINEGEVTRLSFDLESGQRRVLRFPVPPPESWPEDGSAEVILRRDGDTQPMLRSTLAMGPAIRYRPSLGLGQYTLDLILEDGRHLQGRFAIDTLDATDDPLEIPMRLIGR